MWCSLLAAASVVAVSLFSLLVDATALDDYVWKSDPAYTYTDTGRKLHGPGWSAHVLNMTSQTWLNEGEWCSESSCENKWWHYFVVIVPDELDPRFLGTGLIYNTHGTNEPNSEPRSNQEDITLISTIAVDVKMVAGVLFQIPNQKIKFHADPEHQFRQEDSLIAYCWAWFLRDTSRPEVLPRFPMTKAVTKAFDTLVDYRSKQTESKQQIKQYIVAGASKRGWTAWTTAAVDHARVIAVIPIVMDIIHMIPNLLHQQRSFGGYSYALKDYYEQNITQNLHAPNTLTLMHLVDPYYYIKRYKGMPKLILNAANDEFMMPDDDQYWWDALPPPKHRVMIQNAEHSMSTGLGELVTTIEAFLLDVLTHCERPDFDWTIDPHTGDITVINNPHVAIPSKVTMWVLGSTKDTGRRDWRWVQLVDGVPTLELQFWKKTELTAEADSNGHVWVAHQPMPDASGGQPYTAFFVELNFPGQTAREGPTVYSLTTQVSILPPGQFPYAACDPVDDGCRGKLV